MSARILATTKLAVRPGVHARRFESELVVLDLNGGNYFSLDAIGVAMWERFVAGRTPAQTVEDLLVEYEVSREQLESDVLDLATELVARGLLAATGGEPT